MVRYGRTLGVPIRKMHTAFCIPLMKGKLHTMMCWLELLGSLKCRATGLDASISSGLPFVLAPYILGPPRCCS